MRSKWTVEVGNPDGSTTLITTANTPEIANHNFEHAKRIQPTAQRVEWREVKPGDQVISKEETEALLWWIDWTKEHMIQLTDSTAEMARSGEIEKSAGVSWKERVRGVLALETRLKGK